MTDAETEIAREIDTDNERARREGVRAESYALRNMLLSIGNPQAVARLAIPIHMGLSPDRVRFLAAWAPDLVYSLEDDTVWWDKAWNEPADDDMLRAMAGIQDAVSVLSHTIKQRQDAMATTVEAKEGAGKPPSRTDDRPVDRMEADGRIEEGAKKSARGLSCSYCVRSSRRSWGYLAGDNCPSCGVGRLALDVLHPNLVCRVAPVEPPT